MPWYKFSAVQTIEYNNNMRPIHVADYDFFLHDPPADVLREALDSFFEAGYTQKHWEAVEDSKVPEWAVEKTIKRRRELAQHSLEVLLALGADKEER